MSFEAQDNENDTQGAGDPPQDAHAAEAEDPQINFEPVIKLHAGVEVKTHEEDEEILFKMRAKLFRFDSKENQWKERGTGDVKFLRHNETKKIRLLMRRERTLKVCANHYVSPILKLEENISSDRSWLWTTTDHAEDPPTKETFAIRFANTENAQKEVEKLSSETSSTPSTPTKEREHDSSSTENTPKKEGEEETSD